MIERVTRRAHRILGASLIVGALVLAVTSFTDRYALHPFSGIGWAAERELMVIELFLFGAALLFAIRRSSRLLSFGTTLLLGAVAFAAELRYWWPSFALVCVSALMLSVLTASYPGPRGWRVASVFAAVCLVLACGYLMVGTVRWIHQPRLSAVAASPPSPLTVPGKGCEGLAERLDAPAQSLFTRTLQSQPWELRPVFCDGVRTDFAAGANTQQLLDDIPFEAFRLDGYLRSGVVPKRYFGFLDERGDTAEAETALRHTLEVAVPLINRYAERSRKTVRITEMEVAVTFLAEGGALLLTSGVDHLDRIHPVRDMGLDGYQTGFEDFASLVAELDAALNTDLGHLTAKVGWQRWLLRPMTFREAVLGTSVMYLWEKALSARLAANDGRTLMALPLDAQFVTTSLVYNCGQLFSAERVTQILELSTGAYLAQLNADSAPRRSPLPVYAPGEARRRLLEGEGFPVQLTSWSAVVHVLQRYGAWVALERQGRSFDAEGRFVRRESRQSNRGLLPDSVLRHE